MSSHATAVQIYLITASDDDSDDGTNRKDVSLILGAHF
jgi:hypothetical protein